jgi:protoporphyrinogen oxidase
MAKSCKPHVVIVGGGFTGLSAAYQLSKQDISVTVVERKSSLGGLADAFELDDQRLGKFYYTLFTNDKDITDLIKELNCTERLISSPVKTSIYYNNGFYNLSKPTDLLKFSPLKLSDRLCFGLSVLQAKRIKDWKQFESLTAKEWLIKKCGSEVYKIVWEPLLKGKFEHFADQISAVWMWNKLALRGASRSRTGQELHLYYQNSFAALAEKIADAITLSGNFVKTAEPAQSLVVENEIIKAVKTTNNIIQANAVILTPALPIIADLVGPYVSKEYTAGLRRIEYLANFCLVLDLNKSLSDIYWLNVNETEFPFVGIIQYSNLYSLDNWKNKNIVYLSKYLTATNKLYQMGPKQLLEYLIPYIKRMFPEFNSSWINNYFLWKALYSQPVIEKDYHKLIPPHQTPIKGLYIATMAQIYPQDRGINYAVRQGRYIGDMVAADLT